VRIEQDGDSWWKTIDKVVDERWGHGNRLDQRLSDTIEVCNRLSAVELHRPEWNAVSDFYDVTDRLIHEYANNRDVAGEYRGDLFRARRIAISRTRRPENESNR